MPFSSTDRFSYSEVADPGSRYANLSPAELRALATAPRREQAEAFAASILRNPEVRAVLERLAPLDLPPWCLTAGCLVQTIWNIESGRKDLRTGIRDHDVFFFDDTDLSYEAEDAVIRRCLEACADLDIEIEPRNQARVHLWYPEKFGRAIPPLRSLEHAIRSFPVTCCSVGASLSRDGELTVHSTHGYRELFSMTLSPSRTANAPREVYDAKTARWLAVWPRLTKTPVADQRAG